MTIEATGCTAVRGTGCEEFAYEATNLLPPPEAGGADLNDSLAMLLALLSKQNQSDVRGSKNDIDSAKHVREQKLKEAEEAYQKMKDAQNNPFGFLGDIFKAIFAAASVLATAATGGACAPLAASAMGFGTVASETHCFGDLSDVIGAASNFVSSCGLGNLGLIAGDAAAFTGAVGAETKAFDADVALALTMGGAGVKLWSTTAAGVVGDPSGTNALGAAAIAGRAVCDVGRAVNDHDAANAAIDAKAARQAMRRLDRIVATLIDAAKEVQKSHNQAVTSVEGAIETNNQTAAFTAGALRA